MSNINVLMLVPDYPPSLYGGVGTHVYHLAKELISIGCSVTVIEGRSDHYLNEIYEETIEESIKVIRFARNFENENHYKELGLDYFTFRWAHNNMTIMIPIIKYLKENSFDIIHTHDLFTALVYDAVKTVYSIPAVATIHARSAKITSFDDSSRRYTRINADRIITVSEALKQEIVDRYGEDDLFPSIEVIHNGVDVSIDSYSGSEKDNNLITYCGRIFHSKGCEVLIRAFSQLIRRDRKYSELKLNFLGDGPLLEEMKKIAESIGISNRVIFSGFVDNEEVRQTVRRAILHIVPSTYEPFGLTALEAMAEGTCVIASAVGGLKEFINTGYNGVLVPANDVDALARSMEQLLGDAELRETLASRGLQTAKGNQWFSVAEKTMRVYQDVLLSSNSN